MRPTSIVGIVLAILLVVGLVLLAMFCLIDRNRCLGYILNIRRRKDDNMPSIFRPSVKFFRRQHLGSQMELTDSIPFNDRSFKTMSVGFNNPMFGSQPIDEVHIN
jgi:hypothetical protein